MPAQTPETLPPLPPLLSLAESSARTGLSQKTLRRRIADGILPAYRLGPRSIRVKPEDLDNLLRPIPVRAEEARP